MTTRLAVAITAAILFGGMLYSLSGSPTLDAQAQGVVCATPTPTLTPTPEGDTPTPTPPPGGDDPGVSHGILRLGDGHGQSNPRLHVFVC